MSLRGRLASVERRVPKPEQDPVEAYFTDEERRQVAEATRAAKDEGLVVDFDNVPMLGLVYYRALLRMPEPPVPREEAATLEKAYARAVERSQWWRSGLHWQDRLQTLSDQKDASPEDLEQAQQRMDSAARCLRNGFHKYDSSCEDCGWGFVGMDRRKPCEMCGGRVFLFGYYYRHLASIEELNKLISYARDRYPKTCEKYSRFLRLRTEDESKEATADDLSMSTASPIRSE